MTSKMSQALKRRGLWGEDIIDVLQELMPDDVIGSFYSLETVEQYLKQAKADTATRIINALEQKDIYWRDTGDKVILDNDFFEATIGVNISFKKFKARLQKGDCTGAELMMLEEKFIENPEFYTKEPSQLNLL